MLRIAIIEQNEILQEQLRRYLEKFAEDSGERCQPVFLTDELDFLENYSFSYDAVIIDTQLRLLGGLDVAKKIRESDSRVELVLLSPDSNLAICGYTVEAADFLLQPLRYDGFARAMQKILSRGRRKNAASVIIRSKGIYRRVRAQDIMYVEVSGHTLIYHLYGETISVIGQLAAVEATLAACGFFRCSAAYMINLHSVERYTGKNVYIGGQSIPISRSQKKALFLLLGEEERLWNGEGDRAFAESGEGDEPRRKAAAGQDV